MRGRGSGRRDAAHARERVDRILDRGQQRRAVGKDRVGVERVRVGERSNRGPAVNARRKIFEPSLFDGADVMNAQTCSR